MAQVTGFTSSRMLEIENNTVVDGSIVGDDLILTTFGGTDINAGNVRGPVGPEGPIGEVSQADLDAALAAEHIGAAQLEANAVTTAKIANDAVTNAKIGPAAVGSTEIANDSVNSQHYVAGSIDNEHLATDSVTAAKIAANAVGSSELASNSVIEATISNGAVTNAKLGTDAVNGSKIANDSINSEHYVDGSIDAAHIANNAVQEAKILNGAVTRNKIDMGTAKEWADWSGGSFTLSTTQQGLVNLFGFTAPAGSIVFVTIQVDVRCTTSVTQNNPGSAIFELGLNGGNPPAGGRGQMVWSPGRIEVGESPRVTLSNTWMFQMTSSVSGGYISLLGNKNTSTSGVTFEALSTTPGGAEGNSHSWISYTVFRA